MSRIGKKAMMAAAVLPALVTVAVASPAAAAPPTTPSFQDSAFGSGSQASFTTFDFHVTSGPSGQNPSGFAITDAFGAHFVASSITCLAISGNTATYAGALEPNLFSLTYYKVTDIDNGPAGSNLDVVAGEASNAPYDCSTRSYGSIGPITSGDVVVIDSPPPPTSTRQCLDGGYQAYGFAHTGRCIAYVHHNSRTAQRLADRKARG